MTRSGVAPGEIDHVIFGNALQTSGDAIYGARHVGLKAGVPKEVPALTVNRLCGSGFESIVQGAHRILLGEARDRARRRHGEHVAGAARHPRRAARACASARASSRIP